jgi:hypothetical protein
MARPPSLIGNWKLFVPPPPQNEAEHQFLGDVLCKLTKTHRGNRYYRKLSIKHVKRFMEDKPHQAPTAENPNPSGPKSWRAALYKHASMNVIFFMRRQPRSPYLPRYCMTASAVGTWAADSFTATLAELNELACGFQMYNVDEDDNPLPLEILSTYNDTVTVTINNVDVDVPNCPTSDTDLAVLYKLAFDGGYITYNSTPLNDPGDPDYDPESETLYRWELVPQCPELRKRNQ